MIWYIAGSLGLNSNRRGIGEWLGEKGEKEGLEKGKEEGMKKEKEEEGDGDLKNEKNEGDEDKKMRRGRGCEGGV